MPLIFQTVCFDPFSLKAKIKVLSSSVFSFTFGEFQNMLQGLRHFRYFGL